LIIFGELLFVIAHENHLLFNTVSFASLSGSELSTIHAQAITVKILFIFDTKAVLITIAVSKKSSHNIPNAQP